jgi:hypothetical protein
MQFERRYAELIRNGEVTTTFRRWRRPQVVAGRRYRVAWIGFIDVLRILDVQRESVTTAHARRAGFASVGDLFEYLDGKSVAAGTTLYRIDLRYCGDATPDPRAQLARHIASTDESDALRTRLDAMDARSSHGPWTRRILALVATAPATRAGDLAARIGWDTPTFKTHFRKLKALGLTESLDVGYRLSPRGAAFVRKYG